MGQWFSNKGQILQTALTGIACIFAGIEVWPNMNNNQQLLSLGSLLFYALVGAVITSFVILFKRSSHATPAIHQPAAPGLDSPCLPHPSNKLEIRSAFYGAGTIRDRDVTEILQKYSKDALVVDISNDLFGPPDPAPNVVKHLRVEYRYNNGAILTVTRPEDTRLILPEDSWLKSQLENALKK